MNFIKYIIINDINSRVNIDFILINTLRSNITLNKKNILLSYTK